MRGSRPRLLSSRRRLALAVIGAWLLALAACSGAPPTTTPLPAEFSEPTPAPVPAGLFTPRANTPETAFVKLSVGYNHSCGLTESGRAVCWGLRKGELWMAPPEVQFTDIATGYDFSCGLTRAKAIQCWGSNHRHEVSGAPAGQFQALRLRWHYGCALDEGGAAVCWGGAEQWASRPPPGVAFAKIQAGQWHSCGLTRGDDLRCWGGNESGEGQPLAGPFSEVAAGSDTCVARLGGAPFCQGPNLLNSPESDLTHISVGAGYACGLARDGRLECWNSLGPTLTQPGPFTAVSAGELFLCALRSNGQAECWNRSPDSGAAVPEVAYRDFGGGHFRWPVDMFPWPGGGVAVVERQGTISRYSPEVTRPATASAGTDLQPLLDLVGRVVCCFGETGMFSAAPDPQFQQFPFLYVWHIRQPPDGLPAARLSRFPADGEGVDAAAELVILELGLPLLDFETAQHFGGGLAFGPDGMLYLGIGHNRRSAEAQNTASLWGSIIRIDVRGATPEQPYRIPPDNPLRDTPGARPEIWAYGLRNPWRMSFDSEGRLWVGDVGENSQEEISLVAPGVNLGWPVFEGRRCRAGEMQCAALTEAIPPVLVYGREEGCAIIWGGEYRGRALPQLRGTLLFTDFCSGKVWALENTPETGWQKREIAEFSGQVNSFGTDAAGEMYLLLVHGAIVNLDQLIPAEPAEP